MSRTGARRNFVFCGDIVPRLSGNGTYVKDVLNKLGMQHQGIKAFAKKLAGEKGPKVTAKINDLVNNMGKFDHCSQLIYYEKAEGEPELLSAADFKNKTLADALKLNNIKFKNSEAKIPFFGLGTFLKSLHGFDFEDISGYVGEVHGVLPYASESTPPQTLPSLTSAALPRTLISFALHSMHAAPIA